MKFSDPTPSDKVYDVARDVVMSWTPGEYAYSHNVFFGTDYNDVNNATVSETLGTTVSPGQAKDVNTYNPGILEFGKTYYWRVDEVNEPSKPGEYKGQVWSFTVESEALKLPFASIKKVTALNTQTAIRMIQLTKKGLP